MGDNPETTKAVRVGIIRSREQPLEERVEIFILRMNFSKTIWSFLFFFFLFFWVTTFVILSFWIVNYSDFLSLRVQVDAKILSPSDLERRRRRTRMRWWVPSTLALANLVAGAAQTSSSLPLAFGVEFEFIFPTWTEALNAEQRFTAAALAIYQLGIASETFCSYADAHKQTEWWKVAPDISLVGPVGGFEVVSPILDGEGSVDQVEKVMQGMTNFEAILSESTDFHVHVDATGRSVDEIRNVLKNFIYFEGALDYFQPPNHQAGNNPYTKSLSAHFDSPTMAYKLLDSCTNIECLVDLVQSGASREDKRQHKLNLAPHGDAMSIEFRGHHGTTDSKTATHWVRFTNLFVHGSFKGQVARPDAAVTVEDKLKQMFNMFLPDEASEFFKFYKSRAEALAAKIKEEGPDSILTAKIASLDDLFPDNAGLNDDARAALEAQRRHYERLQMRRKYEKLKNLPTYA